MIDTPAPSPALITVDLGEPARTARIRAAFTTRAAGNLGLDVEDDPGAVHARRAGLRGWAGREVAFANHVHGSTVLDAARPYPAEPLGDAWCAGEPSAVAVLTADCLPVLLYDADTRVIGVAHAGRRGLLDEDVLGAVVRAMRARGAQSIAAVIGPAICGKCYEIGEELAGVLEAAGHPVGVSRWGTPAVDLPQIALTQLHSHGVSATALGICTLEDPRFFSHRSSDRGLGRHAGLIAIDT